MKKLLVLLIFTASYAHAEIYTWTDRGGTKHYTNSIYEIPEKYRDKAKVLDLGIVEKNDAASPPPAGPAQPNPPAPPPPVQQNQQAQPAPAGQRPSERRSHDGQRRMHPGRRSGTERPSGSGN